MENVDFVYYIHTIGCCEGNEEDDDVDDDDVPTYFLQPESGTKPSMSGSGGVPRPFSSSELEKLGTKLCYRQGHGKSTGRGGNWANYVHCGNLCYTAIGKRFNCFRSAIRRVH